MPRMRGTTWASVKKHYSLIPIYVIIGAGAGWAAFYTLRLALKSPEVTWRRHSNPEPWEEYRNKQHKFYSPNLDYSTLESPAPKYKDD